MEGWAGQTKKIKPSHLGSDMDPIILAHHTLFVPILAVQRGIASVRPKLVLLLVGTTPL